MMIDYTTMGFTKRSVFAVAYFSAEKSLLLSSVSLRKTANTLLFAMPLSTG